MTFGNNALELEHKTSGWKFCFTTEDALKAVKNGELEDGDGGVKVGYADAWLKSRTGPSSQLPMPQTVVTKPYDWTYTSVYSGHNISSSSKEITWQPADPGNQSHKIPLAELTRQDPILFYAEIPLYEDELHDNGASQLLVRIRVMPTCIFILARFTLRVDNVLFRNYDTRIYHPFASSPPLFVREMSGWEAPYDRVKRRLPKRDDMTPLTDPTKRVPYEMYCWQFRRECMDWGNYDAEIDSLDGHRDAFAEHAAKQKSVLVEKDIPLEVDTGFLTVTDLNPVDTESYEANLEDYLLSTARDGVQTLLAALFSLPTTSSPDGPLAKVPPPTTQLPRAKPLPKPKPQQNGREFANAKGIQHRKKEKKVWDEEKQEWVDRWGWKGANKKEEGQWLTEVRANADVDHDPSKKSRYERKAKVAKNERQHQQNMARAAQQNGPSTSAAASTVPERKKQIDRTLAVTRSSTASMGKFDKTLDGEKKLKGIKRKFEANEMPAANEKSNNLAILSKLDREPLAKKTRKGPQESAPGSSDVLNVRKAIRSASRGKGSAALAREGGGKGKKGRR
ncbi:Ribosome biogenesis regulatory [Grifola frondosa]|uniref:Ribosome biogenesis regulatory n=1 Tax=Grifola frondosa TaxID=5627 RepID=A0A1C7LZQ6_GRIFR|nr:Ribosome biogenesis regulatory [Grifola frondosa]